MSSIVSPPHANSFVIGTVVINTHNGDTPWIGLWIVTCMLTFPLDFRWNSVSNVSCKVTTVLNNEIFLQWLQKCPIILGHAKNKFPPYFNEYA
jgi:hypothetical protein